MTNSTTLRHLAGAVLIASVAWAAPASSSVPLPATMMSMLSVAEDGAELMKEAAALEAGGMLEAAAAKYSLAAMAFEKAGRFDQQAIALSKSATVLEKAADVLLKGHEPIAGAKAPSSASNAAAQPPGAAVREQAVKLAPLQPRPGYIIGRAVSDAGNPVPNFVVSYSGFEDGKVATQTFGNGDIAETISGSVKGAGGRYAIKVPPGAYRIKPYAIYTYHGRTYNFQMEIVNEPARHDYKGLGLDKLKDGLVRDLVFHMTGKKKGADESSEYLYYDAYYGGRIALDAGQANINVPGIPTEKMLREAYPPDSLIELTLAPQGPLIDGSQGRTVVEKVPLGNAGRWTFGVRGIPIGLYTATARLIKAGGQAIPLRISLTRGKVISHPNALSTILMDWKPSVTVDFPPDDLGPQPVFGVKKVDLYVGE